MSLGPQQPDPNQTPLNIDWGSLAGTLGPQAGQVLSLLQAMQTQREHELATRTAQTAQEATQAQGAYQQAAQAPLPEVSPGDQFLQTLGGNFASVLSGNPSYQQGAQADLQSQRETLQAQRLQNL